MSASERARRNEAMAKRKASGATLAEIAAEFDCARSTVQKALADHAAAHAPEPKAVPVQLSAIDVERSFARVVAGHLVVLDRMEKLVDGASDDHARISAARTFAQAGVHLMGLFAMVGLTPHADEVLLQRALRKRARDASKAEGERLLEGRVAA
jgi:hypothetical protein